VGLLVTGDRSVTVRDWSLSVFATGPWARDIDVICNPSYRPSITTGLAHLNCVDATETSLRAGFEMSMEIWILSASERFRTVVKISPIVAQLRGGRVGRHRRRMAL
jgi:hypothetical protein